MKSEFSFEFLVNAGNLAAGVVLGCVGFVASHASQVTAFGVLFLCFSRVWGSKDRPR